ncbi:MAG: 2-oxoglutarate and iron-dependent oxygenase domain-containing protein [Planctomycetota bacterium]
MGGAEIPVVSVAPLLGGGGDRAAVAAALDRACREQGFFYAVDHGVDAALLGDLAARARTFFALPDGRKAELSMDRAGRAWRGYFPLGGELTSGRPDHKEGLYFGAELGPDHPRVQAGVPLHGANLFPPLPGFREAVLRYIEALTGLGHRLMEGLALGLGQEPDYFAEHGTRDPFVLFRIFHYPPLDPAPEGDERWSVGEHTDYGLLTILAQDDAGGLELKTPAGWRAAPPIDGALLCNIGDMLDRMTGGRYRSTPHRVRNRSGRGRLSFPFFFDPDFDAEVRPIDAAGPVPDDRAGRWDGASVHALSGTYGEYLLAKVARVFPGLGDRVL